MKNANCRTLALMGRYVGEPEGKAKIVRRKWSFLEAIHECNIAGERMFHNRFYDTLFLGSYAQALKSIGDEVAKAKPLYSGTFAIIGEEGKRLGKKVEVRTEYMGERKTLIVATEGARPGIMLCCDHGFMGDGFPKFSFLNAQTNKPITSHEGMLDAPEIIMELDGIYPLEIRNRENGFFQKVADTSTVIHTRPGCVAGLLERGNNLFHGEGWRSVGLYNSPSGNYGILTEPGLHFW